MTVVGFLGILLCLLAIPFFPPARTQRGLALFAALLVLHVAASIVYYRYALTTSADSALYYYDSTGLRRSELQFGTIFTIKLVQYVKALLGGTYLDHFLLFQAIGFWGILLLQRCVEQVQHYYPNDFGVSPYWLLFLPGVHFWTGAIGKDAPLFFATSLAVWAAMRIGTRLPWFLAALAVMVLFRPHIALLSAGALAAAAWFGSRSGLAVRVGLGAIALAAVVTLAGTVETTLKLDLSSPASVGAYLEQQQQKAQWIEGATNLQNTPFIFRLFSLLFRPLFLDASGAFGLISSAENLVFLYIIGFMAATWRTGLEVFRTDVVFRFCLFFWVSLALLLSLTYYNVGLGLRQKMMMVPALFTFFVAQWLLHRSRMQTATRGGPELDLGGGSAELSGGVGSIAPPGGADASMERR